MIQTLSKILGNTQKTVSNWKKEKRPIMELLYKYFTKEELEEFLQTGEVKKLEELNFKNEQERNEEFKLFKEFLEFRKSKKDSNEKN